MLRRFFQTVRWVLTGKDPARPPERISREFELCQDQSFELPLSGRHSDENEFPYLPDENWAQY
jgi:hypothetical protein